MGNKPVHFEILVEDQSGKVMLDILVPKIIGDDHTFRIHSYRGIGRLPKKSKRNNHQGARNRLLLDNLPRLLQGYGKAYKNNSHSHKVIVVCDLDTRCLHQFLQQLKGVFYQACNPQPNAVFCIAIEEAEAWLLGDRHAIEQAYPNAKSDILNKYQPDAICGTWELLADAIHSAFTVDAKIS